MRWHTLRTRLHEKWQRLRADRGGVALLLLLGVAFTLLAFFGYRAGWSANVRHCYVDYAQDGPLVRHLQNNVPPELRERMTIRPLEASVIDDRGTVGYPVATGAIQLRPHPDDPDGPGMLVWFWNPGADGSALAPYEAWLWRETLAYYRTAQSESPPAPEAQPLNLPPIVVQRSTLPGGLDVRYGLLACVWLVVAGRLFHKYG